VRLRHVVADSVVRNSTAIMATTVLNSGLGYLFWIITAHIITPPAVGLVSALSSAMMLAATVASAGFGSALIARLPGRTDPADWSASISAATLVTCVSSFLVAVGTGVAITFLIKRTGSGASLALREALLVLGAIGWGVTLLLDLIYVAERVSQEMLKRNIVFSALRLLLLGISVAVLPRSATSVFGCWVLAAWISVLWSFAVTLPRLKPQFRLATRKIRQETRAMTRILVGHHLITIAAQLPMIVLPILVTARAGATAGGLFYIGWMTGGVFFMVSPAFAASVFAEASHSPARLVPAIRRAAIFIPLLLLPTSVIVLVAGRSVLSLFGARYESALPLLVPLVISAVPDAITNLRVSVLRVRNRLTSAFLLNAGMAVFTLVCSWLFVRSNGIAAVGWSWLAAQTLGCVMIATIVAVRRLRATPHVREGLDDARS